MTRLVIHNYATRNIGKFRATAAVHDHGKGGKCGCGGSCCTGKKLAQKDGYTHAEMGIDVKYAKGPTGGSQTLTAKHYTMPNVLVDPRGYPPDPFFVRAALASNREHKAMLAEGWYVKDIAGYYKKEQRDVGARI